METLYPYINIFSNKKAFQVGCVPPVSVAVSGRGGGMCQPQHICDNNNILNQKWIDDQIHLHHLDGIDIFKNATYFGNFFFIFGNF